MAAQWELWLLSTSKELTCKLQPGLYLWEKQIQSSVMRGVLPSPLHELAW